MRHLAHSGSRCLLHLLCEEAPVEAFVVPRDGQLDRLPAVRLYGPLRQFGAFDQACIASLLAEESPAFAQLMLPSISRFLPELEALAAANAFPNRDKDLARLELANRCPSGRELISRFLQ